MDAPSDEEFELDEDDLDHIEQEEAEDAIRYSKNAARNKVVNPCPNDEFEKNLDKFADKYKDQVDKSHGKFTWGDIRPPKGEGFDDKQRKRIRRKSRDRFPGFFPKANKSGYVTFPPERIKATLQLPKEYLKKSDSEQFQWLDDEMELRDPNYIRKKRRFKGSPKRYTWHHHKDKGKMELVEMTFHEITSHMGGREVWGGGKDKRRLSSSAPTSGKKRQKLKKGAGDDSEDSE